MKEEVLEVGMMVDFGGLSYLELPCINNGARKVSVEVWLKARTGNGIILYNGQEMGKGDYITLLLTNGYVQFFYDLGSGMANIT